jgi:hypothetical protein
VFLTAWETILTNLAAYGADNSIGDGKEEGWKISL